MTKDAEHHPLPRAEHAGPHAEDRRPARQRFVLEIEEPTRRTSLLRNLALLALGALNLGAGPTNPGGRRARVIDRDSGAELDVLLERFGDEAGGAIAEAQEDLERLDVAAFADRWLTTPTSSTPPTP